MKDSFKLLMKMGVQPKHKGLFYLACVLTELKNNPDEMYDLHRCVYPQICSKYQANETCIERNMRFAITNAWQHGNREMMVKLFDPNWCPSVREFISVLAVVLRYTDEEYLNLLN